MLNACRNQGIDPASEAYLIKYGILEYHPPIDEKSVNKYISPQILIDQKSPFDVSILLNGNFLGRLQNDPSDPENADPYFQLEQFIDGNWVAIKNGPGIDYAQDSNRVSIKCFHNYLLQKLVSNQRSNNGFAPGRYRISAVTSEKQVYTSKDFYIGMLANTEMNRYQRLGKAAGNAPSYSTDNFGNIQIVTPFYPVKTNESGAMHSTYHFQYEWVSQKGFRNEPPKPGDLEMDQFITQLPTAKVFVNGVAFSGRIKFAFAYSVMSAPRSYIQHDLFVIDYQSGSPISKKQLVDVDLMTEAKPIR